MSQLHETFVPEETGPPPPDNRLSNDVIANSELWSNEILHSMYLASMANAISSMANATRYMNTLKYKCEAGDDSARRLLRQIPEASDYILQWDKNNANPNEE